MLIIAVELAGLNMPLVIAPTMIKQRRQQPVRIGAQKAADASDTIMNNTPKSPAGAAQAGRSDNR